MESFGYVGKVPLSPPSNTGGLINISIKTGMHQGQLRLLIAMTFPSRRMFSFQPSFVLANEAIQAVNRDLEIFLNEDTTHPEIVANLHDVGDQLSKVLLRTDPEADAVEEMAALRDQLQLYAEAPIVYDYNTPIPIELMTFGGPIGGVGPFPPC